MKNLDKHIELISKYLAGDSTKEETQELFNWIELNPANKAHFEAYKRAWELTETSFDEEVSSIDLNFEWNQFSSEINNEEEAKIISIKPTERNKWSIFNIAAAVAAIFIIGFGTLYIFNPKTNELVAENKITDYELPDGSNISLNRHSELEYEKSFNKNTRIVKLKGEAFFKVSHNPKKPFIINTGALNIEVLGTSFNVNAKNKKGDVEVNVESGIVAIYTKEDKSDSVLLYAGDKAFFNRAHKNIQKKANDNLNYLAWKTKNLVFEKTELKDIVLTLNNTYDAKIKIKNPEIKNCTLTNEFNNQSLESILNVLKATLDLKIEKRGEMYEISGKGCKIDN